MDIIYPNWFSVNMLRIYFYLKCIYYFEKLQVNIIWKQKKWSYFEDFISFILLRCSIFIICRSVFSSILDGSLPIPIIIIISIGSLWKFEKKMDLFQVDQREKKMDFSNPDATSEIFLNILIKPYINTISVSWK